MGIALNRNGVGLVALIVIVASGGAFTQTAPPLPSKPEFTSTTNLIEVPLVVRARNGKSILDLSAEDLTVRDNGNAQKIAHFRLVRFDQNAINDFPVAPAHSVSIANKHTGRYLMVVIPRLGFGSRYRAIEAVQKAFQSGLVGKGDSVAIIDNSGIAQPFTSDSARTEQTIAAIRNKAIGPCWEGDWLPKARSLMGKLQQVTGRKFVIMFTDSGGADACFRPAANSPWVLVSDALAVNASVYPADPRGVEPLIPFGDASQSGTSFGPDIGGSILRDLSVRSSRLAYQSMELNDAAKSTGGRALTGNNDLSAAFRLVNEDSTYYQVGYYLNDLQADGQFHEISVKVNRNNVRILHKPGYFAPLAFSELSRAKKRDWLYQALVSGRPLTDIQFIARDFAFPSSEGGNRSRVAVTLEMRWWVPRDLPKPTRQWISLVGLLRQNGLPITQFAKETSWTAEGIGTDGEYSLRRARYNLLLPLASGQYELSIGAADLDANVLGSTAFELRVPSRKERASLFLGPVVVADKLLPLAPDEANGFKPAKSTRDPLLWYSERVLPAPVPLFAPSDTVYFFTRVYGNVVNGAPVDFCLTIHDGKSRTVVGPLEQKSTQTVELNNGVPFLYALDLKRFNLPAGVYKVEIKVTGGGADSRSAAFFGISSD